jgi:superfamily II DNA helicase RecQ
MMFLMALRQDLVRRCAELGIQFAMWDETAVTDEQRIIGCPLVFVAVETAVGTFFHTFLARLDAAQRLDRVILDEAHLVLTSSHYRPKMGLIRQLRNLRAQFVFLTGTLPPSMLQQSLLLSEPTVIRSTTFRKDLRYAVERLPPENPGSHFSTWPRRKSRRGWAR